jgi:outer membrane protein assembly factor BamB
MKRLPPLAVLLALAATLAACESAETNSSAPLRPAASVQTGLPIEPFDAAEMGYVTRWVANLSLEKRQEIRRATVLEELGLLITVEKPTNLVSAIALRDGELVWRQVIGNTQETLFEPYTVNEEQLLINSETRVYVLSAADGRIEGISELESTVVSNPVVFGDDAVFGGRNGVVFAHDIRAGFSKWSYKLTASILTGPVRSGSNVFVADSAGSYAMFDGNEGTLLWRNRTWGGVTAQPAVSLSGIYVACRDRSLYAFNRITGNDIWIYRTTVPLTDDPRPLGRLILQPVPDQGLHAIGATDGELKWTYEEPVEPIKLIDDRLLFMAPQRFLMLDAESGEVVEQFPTRTLRKAVPGPDDSLILITPKGEILRLDPRQ